MLHDALSTATCTCATPTRDVDTVHSFQRARDSSGPRNRIRMTLNTYQRVAPLPARIGR